MNQNDAVLMDNTSFQILKCEADIIFDPKVFGISPIWENDINFEYSCIYEIKDYQLYINSFTVSSDEGFRVINGIKPEPCITDKAVETVTYQNIMEPIKFSGAMLLGNTILREYCNSDDAPCYCYKQVREINFQDGKLVISIDHSRSMLRIRKNIDMGLRKMDNKRDEKCIQYFLKTSFIGDYENMEKKKKPRSKKKINLKTYIEKVKDYRFKVSI